MAVKPNDVIMDELVRWLRPRLTPLIVEKKFETTPDADKVVMTTFEELHEITTRHPAFPLGLDFKSRGGHRTFLYQCRIDLAEESCWFAPVYGEGLKWTSDPVLGIRWFDEMQMDRAENRATKAVQLWQIAHDQAPRRLKPVLKYLGKDAETFRLGIVSIKRGHTSLFKRIMQGRLKPPRTNGEPAQYLCQICGETFGAQVVHCPECAHHYPLLDGECGNCHLKWSYDAEAAVLVEN